ANPVAQRRFHRAEPSRFRARPLMRQAWRRRISALWVGLRRAHNCRIKTASTKNAVEAGRVAMLSRRSFLNSALGAGAALAASRAPQAVAQAGGRMIVDAQVHLWKAESPDWKWVPGARPQLPEPFTIEKLVPMMNEAGVNRVVIVPPSWIGDRNDYGLEAVQ